MRLFRKLQICILNLKTKLIMNSFWGVTANILQNILFSLFFVIIARRYNSTDFSSYILANTMYGLVLAFSSLGLGQWFVRRLLEEVDKELLIHQFFKVQFLIGFLFYAINILLTFILYKDQLIRQLSVLIGLNVIFDNIIYVIKYINIAQLNQKKTFIIQTIESILKIILGAIVLFIPVSIVFLSLMIITLRFLTLNVFLHVGTDCPIRIFYFIRAKIDFKVFREIVINNWPFIVIGSTSVVFWKLGNILIANYMTLSEVAHYEISFKLFSMAEVIPVIVSSTIFPVLLKKLKEDKVDAMQFYHAVFICYALYGYLAFAFIYSFSDQIIPWLFGSNYSITSLYCKGMFLTMLVFPTAILQANLIVALHREKTDMWLNIISLTLNVLISIILMRYIRSITIINVSIFISFLFFHILQDYFLIQWKVLRLNQVFHFYGILAIATIGYYFLSKIVLPFFVFLFFTSFVLAFIYFIFFSKYKRKINLSTT